jgi:hypothetical protein
MKDENLRRYGQRLSGPAIRDKTSALHIQGHNYRWTASIQRDSLHIDITMESPQMNGDTHRNPSYLFVTQDGWDRMGVFFFIS